MGAETQKSATVNDVSVSQIFLCSCEVSGEVVQKAFAINWLCKDPNVRAMHPGVLLKDLKVHQLIYFTEDAA